MLANNRRWDEIKRWAKWTARTAQLETVGTSVLLPILECIFVNLYTGSPSGQGTGFLIALAGLGILHAGLVLLILIRQKTNPVAIAADALELEEKIEQVTRESEEKVASAKERERVNVSSVREALSRKSDAHQMLRSVLDMFNLQTCQLDPEAPDAFGKGLMPIIQNVACGAWRTLEISDDRFTIELYCLDPTCSGEAEHVNPLSTEKVDAPFSDAYVYTGFVEPALFYSSSGLNPRELNLMGPGSAFHWGWARKVSGTCYVHSDKQIFYDRDQPRANLYFRNVATVPVRLVCTPDCIGILAVTSMQEEPFSSEVLDSMEFLSSVISQYIASHGRCITEHRERKRKEDEKRKRAENKARKQLLEEGGTKSGEMEADDV